MKITKFVHACLLVEMPAPVNRTALFDPGVFSEAALDIDSLEFLDDIIITHQHSDHMHPPLIKKLQTKFPNVRITAPADAAAVLTTEGITGVTSDSSEGIVFFKAPHEHGEPMFPTPDNIGVHYLDLLSDPGDSHSFDETKSVLALPVTAPWGATVKAVNLALQLKPQYILPIHDWHWSDAARENMYEGLEKAFGQEGITFLPLMTGKPVVINI